MTCVPPCGDSRRLIPFDGSFRPSRGQCVSLEAEANMNKWIIAVALFLTVPSLGLAAPIVAPPAPETLVEGHTVFTVIENIYQANVTQEEFGAAVAVLVREYEAQNVATRFPGVLWFNDQYLVNPSAADNDENDYRYPCTGAVIAAEPGTVIPTDGAQNYFAGAANGDLYVESYHVTDPNDNVWDVDLWSQTGTGLSIWTVAMKNNQASYGEADDDSNCAAYTDSPTGGPTVGPFVDFPCEDAPFQDAGDCNRVIQTGLNPGVKDPGSNGVEYPCDGCEAIRYNALLYFRTVHLTAGATQKDHSVPSGDASGCHAGTAWPCPGGDDDAEGNSHPYNPYTQGDATTYFPGYTYDGYKNHGGSCDLTIATDGTSDCHATYDVQIYYGYAGGPLARDFYVFDTEGSTAPFHCHAEVADQYTPAEDGVPPEYCNQEDIVDEYYGPHYGSTQSNYGGQ